MIASFSITSTDNSTAHGIGFISLIPVKRVRFTSSEAGVTIVGAFGTVGAGLGTVEIPGYSGPNGTTVEHDFACVFVTGDFLEIEKLTASDAAAVDRFGNSVAISGDIAVVGAYLNDDAGTQSGSAYIYDSRDIDCNANGICDTIELQAGTSCDQNGNLIPDECEAYCPGDSDCDGDVDINVLRAVILNWNSTGPHGDLDFNGTVNVNDLRIVILNWGPC